MKLTTCQMGKREHNDYDGVIQKKINIITRDLEEDNYEEVFNELIATIKEIKESFGEKYVGSTNDINNYN